MKYTIASAKKILSPLGISLRHTDGEYRVNVRNGSESTAYYTNDLEDAMVTGTLMSNDRSAREFCMADTQIGSTRP